MSLCNSSHQFCKNIPLSFGFITTWNQGVFLWSPCIFHNSANRKSKTWQLINKILDPVLCSCRQRSRGGRNWVWQVREYDVKCTAVCNLSAVNQWAVLMLSFDSLAVRSDCQNNLLSFLTFSTKPFTFDIRLPFGPLINTMQDDDVSLTPCHQPGGPGVDYRTCYLMKSG